MYVILKFVKKFKKKKRKKTNKTFALMTRTDDGPISVAARRPTLDRLPSKRLFQEWIRPNRWSGTGRPADWTPVTRKWCKCYTPRPSTAIRSAWVTWTFVWTEDTRNRSVWMLPVSMRWWWWIERKRKKEIIYRYWKKRSRLWNACCYPL